MRPSFPLSLKISLWLCLNLLALAAIAAALLLAQFGPGLETLARGPIGARLQAAGETVVADLAAAPAAERDGILERWGKTYGVRLTLWRNSDGRIAGADRDLPAAVRELVLGRPGPDGPRGQSGPPEWGGGPDRPPPPPGPPQGEAGGPDRRRGIFILRAGAPASYWLGLRVPWSEGPAHLPVAATLVAAAPSWLAVARLFDWTPWLEAAGAALLISALFWWPLVRGLTRSLSSMSAAADRIAEGRLDTRVGVRRRDEIGALGVAIDRMAGRLESLVGGQKRFLADVAHELCSPLSRLQLSVGILEERLPAELQPALAEIREEAQIIAELTGALLNFTRAGLAAHAAATGACELAGLVRSALEREAAGKSAAVSIPAGLTVVADSDRLARALANLVRNAFSHGRGTQVEIVARAEGGQVNLSVSDRGPGLGAEHLERLGEPFYRPDAARARECGGTGLGLAIVRECIAACGGTVRFSTRSGGGFSAEILLPAGPTAPLEGA